MAADGAPTTAPPAASTLADALRNAAAGRTGGHVFHLDAGPVRLGWDELLARSLRLAGALAERGIERGGAVGIAGPNEPEWIVGAFAAWLAGAAVVPIPVPLRLRSLDAFRAQLDAIVATAGCGVVLASPTCAAAVPPALALAWDAEADGAPSVDSGPEDVAIVQFTSGSTAAPRGAALTHRAVLAQLRELDERRVLVDPDIRVAAWTPFFHDLGLILAVVAPVAFASTAHQLPTARFVRDPSAWFRLIGAEQATLTVGPSSAWAAALRRVGRSRDRFDLSSLTFAGFGAEGVDPEAVDALLAQAPGIGLDPSVLANTYGLAEAVLSVTANRPGEGLSFDLVDADALAHGTAAPVATGGRRIISAGAPVIGTEVRIVRDGQAVDEREVGEIQARGDSLMRGYVGAGVEQPFVDGWLRTGDLGYLAKGELHVTGRMKDVIIVMGNNHHPEELEWAAGRVAGVKAGRRVAFDAGQDGRGRIVLLVEPAGAALDPAALSEAVLNATANATGLTPNEVVVVPRGAIQLTTSGKLRRAAMREAFLAGTIGGTADDVSAD